MQQSFFPMWTCHDRPIKVTFKRAKHLLIPSSRLSFWVLDWWRICTKSSWASYHSPSLSLRPTLPIYVSTFLFKVQRQGHCGVMEKAFSYRHWVLLKCKQGNVTKLISSLQWHLNSIKYDKIQPMHHWAWNQMKNVFLINTFSSLFLSVREKPMLKDR